ncbi:MAG: hypothetical protein U0326_12500 [Polyangiales bacterium]
MPEAPDEKTETADASSTKPDEAATADVAPTTTAETPETPAKHPDVLAMENALRRGDFQDAREIARRLSESPDASLREAGRTMLKRFELDPYVLGALAFTGALIVALAARYLGHH